MVRILGRLRTTVLGERAIYQCSFYYASSQLRTSFSDTWYQKLLLNTLVFPLAVQVFKEVLERVAMKVVAEHGEIYLGVLFLTRSQLFNFTNKG